MPELSFNGSTVELDNGDLYTWLRDCAVPLNNHVSLDTEASGRHVDGMWTNNKPGDCDPKARVSTVSLAWRDKHTSRLNTLAVPFDQGMIGGKPGRYDCKTSKRAVVEHTVSCLQRVADSRNENVCTCAPWNFNAEGWQELRTWLIEEVEYIDFFNFKYDAWIMLAGLRNGAHMPCMSSCVGWDHDPFCINRGIDLSPKLAVDVMLWEAIRHPDQPNSLEAVSRRMLGRGKDTSMDAALKSNGVGLTSRYDLVGWPVTSQYAARDAELTFEAGEIERADREDGEILYTDYTIIQREHRKAKLLFKMEQRGVKFNAVECADEARKMHASIAELEKTMPFANVNQATKYFFASKSEGGLGLVPIKLTDKGAPSCDAEVVARLAKEPGHVGEIAGRWAHIANMKSACAKWYDAWPNRVGDDGRIRTNFRQCKMDAEGRKSTAGGAISGRLSADRVQLQGVPQDWRIPQGVKGIKELIEEDEDYELWEMDASNCEVRVAAWLSQCKKLADLINSGVNIHDANTINIFGEQLAQTYPGGWPVGTPLDATYVDADGTPILNKDGEVQPLLSLHPQWKQFRTSAKRGIFGRMYGAGIRTLKSQIDADLKMSIPEKDIRAFMDALDQAYPELAYASRVCQNKADRNLGQGFVKLVSGRRRVFGWAEQPYKAFNACIQGGVSEMMSELMLVVEERFPGVLLSQVHDSLWLRLRKGESERVIAELKAVASEMFEKAFSTPDVPIKFTFDAKALVKN